MTYHKDLEDYTDEVLASMSPAERLRSELSSLNDQIVRAEQKLTGLRSARQKIRRELQRLDKTER